MFRRTVPHLKTGCLSVVGSPRGRPLSAHSVCAMAGTATCIGIGALFTSSHRTFCTTSPCQSQKENATNNTTTGSSSKDGFLSSKTLSIAQTKIGVVQTESGYLYWAEDSEADGKKALQQGLVVPQVILDVSPSMSYYNFDHVARTAVAKWITQVVGTGQCDSRPNITVFASSASSKQLSADRSATPDISTLLNQLHNGLSRPGGTSPETALDEFEEFVCSSSVLEGAHVPVTFLTDGEFNGKSQEDYGKYWPTVAQRLQRIIRDKKLNVPFQVLGLQDDSLPQLIAMSQAWTKAEMPFTYQFVPDRDDIVPAFSSAAQLALSQCIPSVPLLGGQGAKYSLAHNSFLVTGEELHGDADGGPPAGGEAPPLLQYVPSVLQGSPDVWRMWVAETICQLVEQERRIESARQQLLALNLADCECSANAGRILTEMTKDAGSIEEGWVRAKQLATTDCPNATELLGAAEGGDPVYKRLLGWLESSRNAFFFLQRQATTLADNKISHKFKFEGQTWAGCAMRSGHLQASVQERVQSHEDNLTRRGLK